MDCGDLDVDLGQQFPHGEHAARPRTNSVQARSFAEMLEQTLRRYQNRAIGEAHYWECQPLRKYFATGQPPTV